MRPLVVLWSVLLAVLLVGAGLGPGYVLTYDMVWVPDLVLRADVLGVGSALPRAVPSDAVVAVLDELLGGWLLQKVVLLAPLVAGGLGVARLGRALPLSGVLVAVTIYQWNAFVVERLLIGHWPVLVAYGVLPWVLLAGERWRHEGRLPRVLLVLLPLGSLSVSAGLATSVALLAAAAGRRPGGARRSAVAVAMLVAANAPWLVSGVLHAGAGLTDADGARVFALAGEGSVPAPLAALSLGGIWNAEVVPPSRGGLLGWMALVMVVLLAALGARRAAVALGRRAVRALLVCWVVGTGAALLTWAAPGVVGWLAATVPGGGVLRDGGRLLVLAAPALALVCGAGAARVAALNTGVVRVVVAGGLVLLPVLLLSDPLTTSRWRLHAAEYPAEYEAVSQAVRTSLVPGDVLVLPLSSYRQPGWNGDRKVLDPLPRVQPREPVSSDELVVSGTVVAGEDPRVRAAARALAEPTAAARRSALAQLGIGLVVVDRTAPGPPVPAELRRGDLVRGELLALTRIVATSATPVPASWTVAMSVAWLAFLGGPLAAVALLLRRAPALARQVTGRSRSSA
ncbi:hypothetical protein [Nocardioides nanhaiensis]|uniref:YfhO family protein n=1 Tax=Nocardioides nanhaiensis TaxID=1476871 RepID=A0ABP8WYH8_9ACTN